MKEMENWNGEWRMGNGWVPMKERIGRKRLKPSLQMQEKRLVEPIKNLLSVGSTARYLSYFD